MTDESAVRPLEVLLQAIDAMEAGDPLPPAAAAHLSTALRGYLDGRGPLDACLGMRPRPGERSQATRYRQWKRDRALRSAWALCEGETPWAKSNNLAAEVSRYESIIWPRHRTMEAPPAGTSQLRTHLFEAFRAGAIPTTARQLHEICDVS